MNKQTDILALEGESVLVRFRSDTRNPPAGMRGTIHVRENKTADSRVTVSIPFPATFTEPAHEQVVALGAAEIGQLLATGKNDKRELIYDDAARAPM